MIRVRLDRAAGRRHLAVRGHADFAPEGRDIVCAAVSALVETLALGLERITPGNGGARITPGEADFWLEEAADPAADAVFRTIVAGLADLAASYPEFVRFEDRTRSPGRRRRAASGAGGGKPGPETARAEA